MNKVDKRQMPNLERMDERGATRLLQELAADLSPEGEYEIRHPEGYVMEMPQSGERFRSRENIRTFQESFLDNAAPPSIRIRRVIVRESLWVVESVVDYGGGRTSHGAAILELRDGKAWRDTRYFAEPFEASEWRAEWVERMEADTATSVPGDGSRRAADGEEILRLIEGQLEMMRAGDFAGAHEWYDEAVVVEWPQSGERIRGKANLLALRQEYPAGVEFEARRVVARRDLGVGEYVIRYDGRPVHVLAILEFAGGKVAKETHYFAEPFEAPEWRSHLVEKMGV